MFQAILFDLDNTLYTEESGIFDLIDQRMNEWLMSRLNIPEEECREFRYKYFVKYGTTLRGLMLHHNVDPKDFLEFVHDVPVLEFLSAVEELRKTLEQIHIRKIIFTNSDAKHATRILDALGIRDLFEKIFDIEAMQFIPKPNPQAYRLALEYLNMAACECLLIDDMERNLRPAREFGMQTILIGTRTPDSGPNHIIGNIKELSSILQQLTSS